MAHAGQIGGDRIEPAKIVQEPAVEAVGAKRRLDGRHVERGRRVGHGFHALSSGHSVQYSLPGWTES